MALAPCVIVSVVCLKLVAEPRVATRDAAAFFDMKDLVTKLATHEVERITSHHLNHAEKNRVAADGMNKTLLTSFFFKEDHPHWAEVAGALHVNLHNPYFSRVHVLLESPTGSKCDEFRDRVTNALKWGKWRPDALQRLVCVPWQSQPSYLAFFEYANYNLPGDLVILANTDVTFDESLGLIDSRAFNSGNLGYVISVQPPPYSSEYASMFGTECDTASRCVLGTFGGLSGRSDDDGWFWGGDSWDVYVFRPPFHHDMQENGLFHVMNTEQGENRAGYQLEVKAEVHLSNPCMHIHAFHWHCMGGKMHGARTWDSEEKGKHQVSEIMPCWDCPGMRLPPEKASFKELCAFGSRENLTDKAGNISRAWVNAFPARVDAEFRHPE